MDPKLIEAIALRIKAGHDKESIKTEMLSIGYSEAFFESAYIEALSVTKKDQLGILSNLTTQTGEESMLEEEITNQEVLPSYQSLFDKSWQLTRDNINLLIKAVITFIGTLIFSGIVAVLLMVYIPVHEASGYIFKFVLLFILFVFSFLALTACFNGLLRGLLKRAESDRYTKHFIWVYLNIVGLSLISIYTSVLVQVGYLFLYIPGLMLNVYLLFSLYIAIDGKEKGVNALSLSTAMVFGRFWAIVGRILLSILLLALITIIFILLAPLTIFLKPFLVPVLAVIIISGILITAFWQLCYTVALYEMLKTIPYAKPLPIPIEKLTKIYRAVITLAILGFVIFMALVVVGVVKIEDENSFHPIGSIQIAKDTNVKKELKTAYEMALQYQIENGSFNNVCNSLVIPADAKCESSELNFVIETPLTWGFYCIDSTGYNEVRRRSMINSGLCTQDN